jgi:hypothetical protein
MSILPQTREARWRLLLFPFMVYVVAVPIVAPMSEFIALAAGWHNLGPSGYAAHAILEREHAHRYALLEYGNVVCIVALLIGVATVREKKTRRSLLVFTSLAFALLVLLYPATQYVPTK